MSLVSWPPPPGDLAAAPTPALDEGAEVVGGTSLIWMWGGGAWAGACVGACVEIWTCTGGLCVATGTGMWALGGSCSGMWIWPCGCGWWGGWAWGCGWGGWWWWSWMCMGVGVWWAKDAMGAKGGKREVMSWA